MMKKKKHYDRSQMSTLFLTQDSYLGFPAKIALEDLHLKWPTMEAQQVSDMAASLSESSEWEMCM